jgi:glycine C-acetyltransferase/8-amino-7-oxononanoate synthase
MEVCHAALERGVFAQAIRPPTVPGGSSRLRLAAMATHTAGELEWAAAQLGEAVRGAAAAPGEPESQASPEPGIFVYDAERDEPAFERAA